MNECSTSNGKENNWIYISGGNYKYWLISPVSYDKLRSLNYWNDSNINIDYVYTGMYIRPVVYLKFNIKITSGDGSEQSPYHLSM